MNNFEIIKSGLMTSIQDLGRKGLAYYAIPTSGVMDRNTAKIALLLLNKPEDTALIECTYIPPTIKFNAATKIVLTGAAFNWTINNQRVLINTILNIRQGDILKGQIAKVGFRGYIAFENDLIINPIYKSYSTYTNAKIGGFKGRFLKKGDIIHWKSSGQNTIRHTTIPIYKGPEFHFLTPKNITEFTSNIYTIKADSNRMGVRTNGKPLTDSVAPLKSSLPVLTGFIQLPPSGLPIIVLQDGQTTGGYPRIAYIQERQLSIFNQIPLDGRFQFVLKG